MRYQEFKVVEVYHLFSLKKKVSLLMRFWRSALSLHDFGEQKESRQTWRDKVERVPLTSEGQLRSHSSFW
jgi:hypothetical protein